VIEIKPLPENSKKRRKVILFLLLALFFITITVTWLFGDPEEILNTIGIKNGYILAFVISFFAGFSAFTAVSFYSLLIAFITGGLNPWLLALITGTSLTLGDMFLFYFGSKGREIISGKVDRAISNIAQYFTDHNLKKYIPLFSYIYISVIPLPNDWLLLFLASIRFPQRKMNLIIVLGDYTHVSLLTFLIVRGAMTFG
jgi:membrane protein YqaA with SNARE-associated domain